MIWGIIFFILAFITRSWHTSFSKEGKGFQREKAPKIMWTDTGIFLIIILSIIFALFSLIIFWKNIDYSWYIKLPAGAIIYWLLFWELPLVLFQEPKDN